MSVNFPNQHLQGEWHFIHMEYKSKNSFISASEAFGQHPKCPIAHESTLKRWDLSVNKAPNNNWASTLKCGLNFHHNLYNFPSYAPLESISIANKLTIIQWYNAAYIHTSY